MINKIHFFCSILFLISIQILIAQKDRGLMIDLKQKINTDIEFNNQISSFQFLPIKNFPKYNKAVLEKYSNFHKCDSLSVYTIIFDGNQFYFNLYKTKYIERDKFVKYVQEFKIDTLNLSNTSINNNLLAVIGFKKGKQFIITDTNRNEDFGDDYEYEFDSNFSNELKDNLKYKNEPHLLNYSYSYFNKGKIGTYNKKFVVYPNSNHLFSQRLSQTEKKYLSFLEFKDYWKGSTVIKNNKFEFYVNAINNQFACIYIKPEKIPLSKIDNVYNRQFMHLMKDTITLSENSFVLDSLNVAMTKLYLSPVKRKTDNFGYTIGQNIKNFELYDLNKNQFKILDSLKQKKITLIEFWSTGCGPCRKMIPEMVKTAGTFSSNLKIISIAVEKNEDRLKEFVQKNKMNWTNVFLNENEEHPIIKELKIMANPTFILLDSTGKILWRGATSPYDEILKFSPK